MPRLTNLNKQIETLEGIPVSDLVPGKNLTYKSALVAICELHRPNQAGTGESLQAYDLGLKIFKAMDEIELEKDEIEFLMKITKESSIYLSIVIGKVFHYLKSALAEEKEKKESENTNQ